MTLKIADYEITVSAKHSFESRKSAKTTESFLNLLSIYAREAADRFKSLNCPAIAREADRIASDIFDALDARGVYE